MSFDIDLAVAPPRQTHGATRAAIAGLTATVAMVLAVLTLYAVFLDQGQLLSPMLGKVAVSANYLHEFAHDGRHLLGAPCH